MPVKAVTSEMVRSEVSRFWNAFTEKRSDELAEFYASECSVFGSMNKRAEPGRLAAARRDREYFGRNTELRVSFGEIDVVQLGKDAAVASYNFEFHAMKTSRLGQPDEHIDHGRCSQVFGVDNEGQLKIFHEHMSLSLA